MKLTDWDGTIPEGAVVIARAGGGTVPPYCDTWYWLHDGLLENAEYLYPHSIERLRGECDEVLICYSAEDVIRAVCGHEVNVGVRQQNAAESTPTDVS